MQDQSLKAAGNASPRGRAIGFTMALYQRRLASSPHAAGRNLERRVERIDRRLAELSRPHASTEFDDPRFEDIVDLRGHYSNLPGSRLRALMPSMEWCRTIADLHERLIE